MKKIGTIIGEITCILSLTSAWADTLSQTSLLIQELCSIGYEKHLIQQAIRNKASRCFDTKWKALHAFEATLT